MIESFLPRRWTMPRMEQAVADAIAETGAAGIKDMGKVMAALKAKHAAALDMAKAGPMVKARLGGLNGACHGVTASFLDELRARTPLAGVIGRRVKLARSGQAMERLLPVPR